MTSIPASYSVISQPSVLNTNGNAVQLNGLCLTTNTRVPIGSVLSFPNGSTVETYFGAAANETVIANGGTTSGGNPAGTGYFGGSLGATAVPGALLLTQYPATAVAAYLRGGNAAAVLTLAQIQALSGSLTVIVDGYSHVISSISFSSDNSFSAVASAIQAAFTDPTESSFTASMGASFTASAGSPTTQLVVTSVTGLISIGDTATGTGIPAGTTFQSQLSGTTGGAGTYILNQATTASSASCTCASTVLDVTVDTDIAIAVGQTVSGGVTGSPIITAQLSGTSGTVGTYRVSGAQQHVASQSMTGVATAPTVTFDSVSGAFVITSGITGTPSTAAYATGTLAASLLLTSATGAVLSQGAAATTPAAFMASITSLTTNWATFFTAFDPDGGNGNTIKLQFAAWNNSVAPRYAYIAWDTDQSPVAAVPASSSLGYQVTQALNYNGTIPISEPTDLNHAAFVAGAIAAIDFTAVNGRTSFAYRTQTGLDAAYTTGTAAFNLAGNPFTPGSFGNGYNFVGFFSLPNQNSINLQRGTISGPYQWIDSYVDQIWLNSLFVSTIYNYMLAIKSFPYTPAGYAAFELALTGNPANPGPILQGLNFGAYAGGVTLSPSEITQVNTAAGANIAPTLQAQGYYLQVLDPGATVRKARGSPIVNFWYLDEGSVQAISVNSIEAP